jgi:hypothetical protein
MFVVLGNGSMSKQSMVAFVLCMCFFMCYKFSNFLYYSIMRDGC